ncbi:MAG TPA: hypothetical protein VFP96_05110 [Candidatus Acidoferrum sp.]|nr:hypothetical protein [Candidatus Acidoferrum sp.]
MARSLLGCQVESQKAKTERNPALPENVGSTNRIDPKHARYPVYLQ